MQLGEKQTETEIETEMLVIHPVLNENLDNIYLLVNSQTQLQIVLCKEHSEGLYKRVEYRLTVLQRPRQWQEADRKGRIFSLRGSPHSFGQMSKSKGSHEAWVN